MAEGFSERAQRVKELLAHRDTTFLLVTAPSREAIDEGVYFWRRLKEAHLPFGGVVVNKVHHDFVRPLEPGAFARDARDEIEQEILARLPAELEQSLDDATLPRACTRTSRTTARWRSATARTWRASPQRLEEDCVLCVPYFDEDVHDIDGLAQVNRYLFSSSAERREMLEQRRAC